MKILIHSETNERTIKRNLGRSEYSYYFVLRDFRPLLERLGEVIEVFEPETEVDAIWTKATVANETCVFLCFNPPHKLPLGLRCLTVPVFAWEFDTIPDEIPDGDERQDWIAVLRRFGRAIVHSTHTARAMREALGADYPVSVIPCPVWDRFAPLRERARASGDVDGGRDILVHAPVLDSRTWALDGYERRRPLAERRERVAAALAAPGSPVRICLAGVVYATVLNPFDGRKRAWDMLAHFVWAFRDRPDATLLIKTSHPDVLLVMTFLLADFVELLPFACRIVVVHGFLSIAEYESLIEASTYIVNCSAGEGQCLPLMEFMSSGKPAIAPTNTAMADYIDETDAFVVEGGMEPTIWPHDERLVFRATRARNDMVSLMRAYQDSFVVARTDPERYRRMSRRAVERLCAHCSDRILLARLRSVLSTEERGRTAAA